MNLNNVDSSWYTHTQYKWSTINFSILLSGKERKEKLKSKIVHESNFLSTIGIGEFQIVFFSSSSFVFSLSSLNKKQWIQSKRPTNTTDLILTFSIYSCHVVVLWMFVSRNENSYAKKKSENKIDRLLWSINLSIIKIWWWWETKYVTRNRIHIITKILLHCFSMYVFCLSFSLSS